MAEPFWSTKYKGTPIRIGLQDLSLRRMMEFRARYGEAYGIPTQFISLLLQGDMIAIACAVWIGQHKAGVEVESLDAIDFSMDDFEPLPDDPKPKAKGKGKTDPPTKEADTPITDSASGASKTSDPDTSSTSPTSAD